MNRCVAIMAAMIVAFASSAVLHVPSAAADSISNPTARWINLNQTCGANFWKTVRTDVVVDPWDWDRPWAYTNSTRDAAGYYRTDIYYKNSFKRTDVARVCKSGHLYRVLTPDRNVHKIQYVNFNCHNGGCALLYKKTTAWTAGYCFKGVRSNGSYYADCDNYM